MKDYIVPLLLFVPAILTLRKKENAYNLLLDGATEGLDLIRCIAPALVILLSAVTMLRESGAMEAMVSFLSPLLTQLRIPPETAMLMLIRPISGSAALAIGCQLMQQYGVNSLVGITTAVMLGSTETTFYTISVYFGAAGIRKTRYTLPAALFADMVGFLSAAWTTRLFFSEIA